MRSKFYIKAEITTSPEHLRERDERDFILVAFYFKRDFFVALLTYLFSYFAQIN